MIIECISTSTRSIVGRHSNSTSTSTIASSCYNYYLTLSRTTTRTRPLLLRSFVVSSCDGKRQQRPPVRVFVHVNDTVITTPQDGTFIMNRMVNRNIHLNWNINSTVTRQICIIQKQQQQQQNQQQRYMSYIRNTSIIRFPVDPNKNNGNPKFEYKRQQQHRMANDTNNTTNSKTNSNKTSSSKNNDNLTTNEVFKTILIGMGKIVIQSSKQIYNNLSNSVKHEFTTTNKLSNKTKATIQSTIVSSNQLVQSITKSILSSPVVTKLHTTTNQLHDTITKSVSSVSTNTKRLSSLSEQVDSTITKAASSASKTLSKAALAAEAYTQRLFKASTTANNNNTNNRSRSHSHINKAKTYIQDKYYQGKIRSTITAASQRLRSYFTIKFPSFSVYQTMQQWYQSLTNIVSKVSSQFYYWSLLAIAVYGISTTVPKLIVQRMMDNKDSSTTSTSTGTTTPTTSNTTTTISTLPSTTMTTTDQNVSQSSASNIDYIINSFWNIVTRGSQQQEQQKHQKQSSESKTLTTVNQQQQQQHNQKQDGNGG